MYYSLLAFSPAMLETNLRYSKGDGRRGMGSLLLLHAGTLYRAGQARREP